MDLILYNPKSKNSRGNIQTHKLIKAYKKANKPFRLKSILKIDDVTSYLDEHTHFQNIILLGGDGTINNLVNNIVHYDLQPDIYLKKNGSGNDFLRTLKIQDHKPQFIMENTLDNTDKHYFINGTGIGLDGLVIDYVDNAKNKGKLTYFLSSFRAMMNFVPEPLDVTIDGESYHFKKAYTLIINNGQFVGGGMRMTPDANLYDEDLEILVVHRVPKYLLLVIFSSVYFGLHTRFKRYVFHKRGRHIKASFTTPQIGQSDGEKFIDVTTVEVQSTNKNIHFRAYK
ncbi:diacylglycerol/lipid kinase family protein [Candidatus Xianfuyuplasma coldseepsis]|uniref:DAGKc domain-containing protein n=1 Tax=Candidatus Xianfuyuplasma coldseepsis TaxID=2782163 RepID=A0A7L7KQ31_9MOLU|nr:diacylglycerol kinase family protein [Xianfuyuplasma coldseepsis]QMS84901.1 hypothetical protein G4Z02_03745 [Xianfuyuplasma coldseepsis]